MQQSRNPYQILIFVSNGVIRALTALGLPFGPWRAVVDTIPCGTVCRAGQVEAIANKWNSAYDKYQCQFGIKLTFCTKMSYFQQDFEAFSSLFLLRKYEYILKFNTISVVYP